MQGSSRRQAGQASGPPGTAYTRRDRINALLATNAQIQTAFSKLSQELNALPSRGRAAQRGTGQSPDTNPLQQTAPGADDDEVDWAFAPVSNRGAGQASDRATGQADHATEQGTRDDNMALPRPSRSIPGSVGSGIQREVRESGGYVEADVAAQRQLQLVQGFVDDLARLHHSACRLKVSRFDSVRPFAA